MPLQLQAGSFDEKLLSLREPGLSFVASDPVVGPLPGHRCTVLELRLEFDTSLSAEHLAMRTLLRDRFSGSITGWRRDICLALPISASLEDRQIYVREMCQMIAPHVRLHDLTLEQLAPAIDVMNGSWNILGVFCALDELDARADCAALGASTALEAPCSLQDSKGEVDAFTRSELTQLVCALERQADFAHARFGLDRTLGHIVGARAEPSADALANHAQAQAWSKLAVKVRRMLASRQA